MSELTHFQKAFVNEYTSNGFNATRAYLKIRPDKTYESAQATSSILLLNHIVKAAVNNQIDKLNTKNIASRAYLITEAHGIGTEARSEKQLGVALKAVDQKARLNRLYDTEQPDLMNYQTLIQSLVVNIGGKVEEKSNKQQVIEGEVVK